MTVQLEPSIAAETFRRVMGRYPTGVTVVTTVDERGTEAQPIGTTVNSFTSVSLEPPLVLICVGKERTIHPVIAATRLFAVNVLDDDSGELSDCFAGAPSELPRTAFCDAPYDLGPSGMPLIRGAAAYLECELDWAREAGDHTIYLGRVVGMGEAADDRAPLIYHRGRYLRIERADTTELRGKPDR